MNERDRREIIKAFDEIRQEVHQQLQGIHQRVQAVADRCTDLGSYGGSYGGSSKVDAGRSFLEDHYNYQKTGGYRGWRPGRVRYEPVPGSPGESRPTMPYRK